MNLLCPDPGPYIFQDVLSRGTEEQIQIDLKSSVYFILLETLVSGPWTQAAFLLSSYNLTPSAVTKAGKAAVFERTGSGLAKTHLESCKPAAAATGFVAQRWSFLLCTLVTCWPVSLGDLLVTVCNDGSLAVRRVPRAVTLVTPLCHFCLCPLLCA